tara:strand:- start:6496 stop:7770 length:1275 start_codon:yes stop_codon:yes gene_type:complete
MAFRHEKNKASKRPSLDELLAGPDEFGLLDVHAKVSSSDVALEFTRFEEINQFIDNAGRHPMSTGELNEKTLARRLAGYINNAALHDSLRKHDRHNLLSKGATAKTADVEPSPAKLKPTPMTSPEQVTSLDDIFDSDELGLLDVDEPSLFEMTHVAAASDRESPEDIAQRTRCNDFYAFESIFKETQASLKAGSLEVVRFQKETQIDVGDVFILQGVLCFIDTVGDCQEDEGGRYNPRLRVIFENGTESNLLLRSLARALYKDENGRRIIRDADSIVERFNNITHKDKRSGVIYIVTTKSDNPVLTAIPNLHKIGYTELTVEERTKNAERDTAFLEAPVKILVEIECYNLNPHKFESLIHGFLHAQRLTMTLTGKDGKAYHPKEWFSVPLDTAREVVRRIIDGSIIRYRINNTTGRIVPKTVGL